MQSVLLLSVVFFIPFQGWMTSSSNLSSCFADLGVVLHQDMHAGYLLYPSRSPFHVKHDEAHLVLLS